jgi:hypothetical protein
VRVLAFEVDGTASDISLVGAIRDGWPDVGDVVYLPAELPQGWRLSQSNDPLFWQDGDYLKPAFWYVPMSGPPDAVCAYRVDYTDGQDAIEVSAGYWPASGGSRYFHELAEGASPVDIFLEGDQWGAFVYLDDQTGLAEYHVLFVDRTSGGDPGNIEYVEVAYRSESSRAAAEAIARAIIRAPSGDSGS